MITFADTARDHSVTWWFLIGGLILVLLALLSGPYRWAVAIRSWARRTGEGAAHLVSALAGQASSDATVGCVRRHLDMLRIGGAAAALALLIFNVDWVGFLIIAALLALYEFGLHRLRQLQPAAQPPAPAGVAPPPAPAGPAHDVSATAGPVTPTGPGSEPGPAAEVMHNGHTAR